MIPIIIIISFILESIVTNLVHLNSFFLPLLTLMSLIIIYPYYNRNIKSYLITCFITGLLYDLIYTDTIIVHAFLFTAVGYLITKLNLVFSNNYLNVAVMALICIITYRLISYGMLFITANISFNLSSLLKGIFHSIILNIIYVILLFIITDKISYRFKIRKSN